jgi:hypothetical protein
MKVSSKDFDALCVALGLRPGGWTSDEVQERANCIADLQAESARLRKDSPEAKLFDKMADAIEKKEMITVTLTETQTVDPSPNGTHAATASSAPKGGKAAKPKGGGKPAQAKGGGKPKAQPAAKGGGTATATATKPKARVEGKKPTARELVLKSLTTKPKSVTELKEAAGIAFPPYNITRKLVADGLAKKVENGYVKAK